jgi:hypothetical protein
MRKTLESLLLQTLLQTFAYQEKERPKKMVSSASETELKFHLTNRLPSLKLNALAAEQ